MATTAKKPSPRVLKNLANFDIERFQMERTPYVSKVKKESTAAPLQYKIYPKYNYSKDKDFASATESGEVDTLRFFTPEITMKRGGMQHIDGLHRKEETDCAKIWIPLEEKDGGRPEVRDVLSQLDTFITDKISAGSFISISTAKEPYLPALDYVTCVKKQEADLAKGDTGFIEWERVSVKYNPTYKDAVMTGIEMNVQYGKNKDDPDYQTLKIESIKDLRNHITYNCKIRFVIEVQCFWIQVASKGAGKKKDHLCGFKLVCPMVQIIEAGTKFGGPRTFDYASMINNEDEEDEDEAPAKPAATTKKIARKPVAADSDEEEEKKPAKPVAKKAAAKKPVPESDEEEEPPKPVKKAVAKKPAKKDDSDDE